MKTTQKPTDEMDEAYKQLDAQPSATGVSEAAQGIIPKNDNEDRAEKDEARAKRLYSNDKCEDIDDAYAQLFESIATIIRHK